MRLLPAIAILMLSFTTVLAAPPVVNASRVLGAEVVSAQGEELGAVTDLAVDLGTGVVRYAILYSNGSTVTRPQGKVAAEEVFGVPISALRPGLARDQLVLSGLESASAGETAGGAGESRMIRASTLIGLDVVNSEGRRAGDIVDFALELETGRVLHAVFRSDDPQSPRVELPLSAFSIPPASGNAVLAPGWR